MFLKEPGVLNDSVKYFSTPSDLAKSLLYYVTRCGHFHCDSGYCYSSESVHAYVDSRMTYLLFYIIYGSLSMTIEGHDFIARKGQVVFIDCRKPHYYPADSQVEFLWIHLDGANSRAFPRSTGPKRSTVYSANCCTLPRASRECGRRTRLSTSSSSISTIISTKNSP